jgi:hypothetical protein
MAGNPTSKHPVIFLAIAKGVADELLTISQIDLSRFPDGPDGLLETDFRLISNKHYIDAAQLPSIPDPFQAWDLLLNSDRSSKVGPIPR